MRSKWIPLALLSLATTVYAAPDNSAVQYADGYIMVKPKAGLSETKLNEILARSNGAAIGVERKLDNLGIKFVRVPRGREEEFAEKFGAAQEFEFAEPDYLISPDETTPNDPKYSNQWHLPVVGAPIAWDNSTGSAITVAIVDTGVFADHPDLAGRVLPGRNIPSGNSNTGDIMGHGTAVAGTAAAAGNNGVGIASVAYDARILPVRISDRTDGAAYFSDMAAGITWAADHGARVANLSYGAGGSSVVASAGQYLRNRGGLLFVAAGNASSDPGWSNYDALIVVSATDRSDTLASFSNFGKFVDLSAPGDYIYSTTKSGGYGNWRGTSFASPIAAGIAALVFAGEPTLDPRQAEDIIARSAVDKGLPGWDPQYGNGRVDAGAAVGLTALTKSSDTTPPSVAITNPSDGDVAEGLVPVVVIATDDGTIKSVQLLVDNTPVASDFDAPYEFVWDTAGRSGTTSTLTARATDLANNTADSSPVNITVDSGGSVDDTGPEVRISSPKDGANVSGTVNISATAVDPSGVKQITLKAGGKLLCAATSSVSCGWNTRKLTPGSYAITADAIDSLGNASSASIGVTVGNTTGGGGGIGSGNGKAKGKNK